MRAVLLALAACGPAVTYDTPKDQPTTTPTKTADAPAPGDESLTLSHAIAGQPFTPLVLDTYGVSGAMPPKKTTLDAERKAFASAKSAIDVQVHATYLATMLYVDGGDHKANVAEARDALKLAAAKAGPKDVDELTLQLLARYEMLNADYHAADAAWDQLIKTFPKDKDIELSRAFSAYVKLRLGDPHAAHDVLIDVPDKLPEVQYARAWVLWRSGDAAGGRKELHGALVAWANDSDKEKSEGIRREALAFAAYGGGSTADVDGRDAVQAARAFGEAGRWKDAIAASSDKFDVLEYTRAFDDPDALAKAAIAAFDACGAGCKREGEIADLATALHTTYSVSADPRYYQAAHDLYTYLLPKLANAAIRTKVGDYSGNLEATKKGLKPGKGHLDQAIVDGIVKQHDAEIRGCYEDKLVGNPTFAGQLTIKLDIAQAGTATAAADGDPDIASCATKRAQAWRFPARGSAGKTHVTINYTLAPK